MREVEYKMLSLVCSKITDGSHFSPKEDLNGTYPMLSVKDMTASGFDYTACKYINEQDYKVLVANGCKPQVNDVLVAKDGSYLKTAFVQKEDKEQVILSSIAIITPNLNEVLPEYIVCFFKAPHTKAVVEKHYLTGTAIKRVILKGFRGIKIPIPPLAEQERIVAELDLLSSIIDKKKAQLKELDNLAQSIFYTMFGDPITNEKGWEVKKLGEVAKEKLSYGSGASAIQYNGEIRYIRITDIKDDGDLNCDIVSPSIYDDKYLLNDGDILFARSGATVGKTFQYKSKYGKCIYAGYLIRLIPNKDIILPSFIFGYTKSPFYRSFVSKAQNAVAQPNINAKQYSELLIPLPPLPLQQEFASKIEAIERQKSLIQQSIVETQTLFDSRMEHWFN